MRATAKDLRFNVKELLNTVARGEEVIITYRGKPCAKLIPFTEETESENELFGIWADHVQSEDVNIYIRTIRKGRFDAD
ncbi:MAG: type II toxin-antitoxin system prevent-host-death family antitoxin [Chloroflexi bacterium]|nr:type II toxin-antitoxin system prevent-host-death family antitoxin [Chloroflexota bacterium]